MSEAAEFSAELVAEDGTRHVLEGEQTLGRSPDCGITIEDSRVSRNHAKIKVEGERVTVEDLGSANGTLVNGQRIAAVTQLSNGDTLKLEKHLFTVELTGVEEEEPDPDATVVDMAAVVVPEEDDDATVVSAIPEPPPAAAATRPASVLPGAWEDDGEGEQTQVMGLDSAAGVDLAAKAAVPRMSDLPHLVILSPSGAPEDAVELQPSGGTDPDVWEVGREPTCEIVLAEPSVSGRHAQLVHQSGRWKVVNLVSANGIFVNGEKRLQAFLSDNDEIRLGRATVVFHGPAGGVAAAAPASSAAASAAASGGGGKSKKLLIGGIVAVVVLAAAGVAAFLLL